MKIGVNLLFLVPGDVGGSEPLLTNLVEAVARVGHHVVVFAVSGFRRAYPEIDSVAKIVEAPWSSGAQGARVAAEHSWLAFEARRRKLDVIHHGVGTAPFFKAAPTAVTIHDIQYRHYPENFVKLKRAWLSVNVPFTLRRSDVVCVPSEYVRSDLISSLGAAPDRVKVVPFGSENLFGTQGAEDPEIVRRRYRLDRPFFIYPSRTYPHKNHHMLIQAFASVDEEIDMVLTGASWFLDRDVEAASRRLGLTGRVRHLGLIPRRDLGGMYRAALALVYPTRFEGFGAPVLEAMSLGCPVIAADVTAVPEVVGDSGILLSPDDLPGWTEAMSKLCADEALRDELSLRGLERAAEFRWEDSARRQIEAYEYALSSS